MTAICKSTVIAVVVTYNRFELLQQTILALRAQTFPLTGILVVDNGSTDGSGAWLDSQQDLDVIHQENVGGSGGFYSGIKYAYEHGYDWVWCMDDDVFPEPTCLNCLLEENDTNSGILCPMKVQNNKPFFAEAKTLNLSNPLKKLHKQKVQNADVQSGCSFFIEGMSFEGPLIKREVIKDIGLPNRDFFIFYDDTDYSYRTVQAGYKVKYVPQAIMRKAYFLVDVNKKAKRNNWKLYYYLRNTTFFCKKYGKNTCFRYLGSISWYIKVLLAICKNICFNNKYKLGDIGMLLRMFVKGIKGDLGKM